MLRTNCKQVREAVRNYLLECAVDYELDTMEEIKERFMNEKSHEVKRVGIQNACIDWLRGLALNTAYYYAEERELLNQWLHAEENEENKYSDDKVDQLYWYLMANEIIK